MSETKRPRWEARFEEGAVERARTLMGHAIDVDVIGKDTDDMCRRKPVKSPTGLFISRCRAAYARATRSAPLSAQGKLEDADRHAAFAVQTFQIVAEQQLTPNQIADLLDEAYRQRLNVNLRTITRLRELGNSWPRPGQWAPPIHEGPRNEQEGAGAGADHEAG